MAMQNFNLPYKILVNPPEFFIHNSNNKFIAPLPNLNQRYQEILQQNSIPIYNISNHEEGHIPVEKLESSKSDLNELFPQHIKENEIIAYILKLWSRLDWDINVQKISPKASGDNSKEGSEKRLLLPQHLSNIVKPPKIDDGRFIYCLRRNIFDTKYNPYDLKPVTAEEAKEAKDQVYYTVSASSVTAIYKSDRTNSIDDRNAISLSQCDSTPMLQWLMEKHNFHQLCDIQLFGKFRYWKTFTVWRNKIMSSKIVLHRNYLSTHLSRSDAIFQNCVNMVHNLSEQIINNVNVFSFGAESNLALLYVDVSKSSVIEDFAQSQRKQLTLFTKSMNIIQEKILGYLVETCKMYSEKYKLGDYLEKIKIKKENLTEEEREAFFLHTDRVLVRKSMKSIKDFLRLIDCQLIHLCHGILTASIKQFESYVRRSVDDGQGFLEVLSQNTNKSARSTNATFSSKSTRTINSHNDISMTSMFKKTPMDSSMSIFSINVNLMISEIEDEVEEIEENVMSHHDLETGNTETHPLSSRNNNDVPGSRISERTESSLSILSRSSTVLSSVSSKNANIPRQKSVFDIFDRYSIGDDLLTEIEVPHNQKSVANVSLNPHPKDIIFRLKRIIEEVERSICSVQTMSSRSCLKIYDPTEYDKVQSPTVSGVETSAVSIATNIRLILNTDKSYCDTIRSIFQNFAESFADTCTNLPKFEFCCKYVDEAIKENARISDGDFLWETSEFRNILSHCTDELKTIKNMVITVRIGTVFLALTNLATAVRPYITDVIAIVNEKLSAMATKHNDEFLQHIRTAKKRLELNAETVEDFVEHLEFISKINADLPAMDSEAKAINEMFSIVTNFNVPISAEQLALYRTLNSSLQELKNNIIYHEAKKDENIRKFSQDLELRIEKMRQRIMEIKEKVRNASFMDPNQTQNMIIEQLGSLKTEVQTLGHNLRGYINYQDRFGSSLSKSTSKARFKQMQEFSNGSIGLKLQEDVDEVERDLSMRYLLWETKSEWENWYENVITEKLDQTDINTAHKTVSRISHTIGILEKSLPANDILPALKELVVRCKSNLPIIMALRNPNLLPRHWQKIEKLIGVSLTKNKTITVADLILSKMVNHKLKILEISEYANNEMILEQMLNKVKDVFTALEFRTVVHQNRNTWIIAGVDDINVQLEEAQMTISTIKGSKYVEPINSQVEDWERKLAHMVKVLAEWINCQRLWLYLEQIFSTVDIQRQLPNDTKLFSEVDSEWRTIMQQTSENPFALKCCTKQGILQTLQNSNAKLERIQKSLEDYLETKRIIFPRFFFLSNDELLEILSKAQETEAVQPHLTKLFANIFKLKLDPASQQSQTITHVISYEGEVFPLPRSIRVRGLAEQWLETIEQGMYDSVKRQIKKCISEIRERNFIDWSLNNFGQSVLVSLQIDFSQCVEQCLMSISSMEANESTNMTTIIGDLVDRLEKLALSTSNNLAHHTRQALEAMIVTSVHNRDTAQHLHDKRLTSVEDFEWRKQIRHSWDDYASRCQVMQVDTVFEYGNEYLGCSPRLVITPLTDRCYMTMTGALRFNLGGSAKGPAGTGKTETIKDLSKVIGRQCVVFNCSEKLDNPTVAKLFSGIIQVGSWCCFDEFNRMNVEVLSVIAAQIYSIKAAKDARIERFFFESKEIKLNLYCGIFITMNPSYAGRVELPDNLSSLFRPVAMMVPDYVLISEVILFSEGFITAKKLSSKITSLYRLCNDQLSNQQHYDFGLRAIKSVLVLAGHLRLDHVMNSQLMMLSTDVEMGILVHAINRSNLSRLITSDLPLFNMIMRDLFPDFLSDPEENIVLQKSIEMGYKELGFEHCDKQFEKAKHFYHQLQSRHGVMLLGPSASGKTVIRSVVQRALSVMPLVKAQCQSQSRQSTGPDQSSGSTKTLISGTRAKVDIQVINPKASPVNNLYGYVNQNSFEWIEGLIPIATKKMIAIANKFLAQNYDDKESDHKDSNVNTPVEQSSEEKGGRRRSSLLNVTLSRRLSINPRLSISSVDPLQNVVNKRVSSEDKSSQLKTHRNWQWIVLDGPIDTVWVENLNTVLDDSRILCLTNGERIGIPQSLRFIFEVDNLMNSSPATVSRCAMVYVGPENLNWEPKIKMWMKQKLPNGFPESGRQYLWHLFKISIVSGMKFLDKCSKLQIVPNLSGQSQLLTLCHILEVLISYIGHHGGFGLADSIKENPQEGPISKKGTDDGTKIYDSTKSNVPRREFFLQKNPRDLNTILGKVFVFAYTWSFGAAFARQDDSEVDGLADSDGEEKSGTSIYDVAEEFDFFLRETFDNSSPIGVRLPLNNKTMYSYFLDFENGSFCSWDSLVPSTKSLIDSVGIMNFNSSKSSSQNQSQMIVSLDSVRYSFLTALLLLNKAPVLLAGDIGIGKSVLISNIIENVCQRNGLSVDNPDSILGKVFMQNDKNQNLIESIQNLAKYTDTSSDDDGLEKQVSLPINMETYTSGDVKFNSQTSVERAIEYMTSKMVKRGQGIIGPRKNKKMILFLDDLHVPSADEFGSQPTLEMVRQWVELNGFYDNTSMAWTYLMDTNIIAACSPNYHSPMSERLTKNFCVITLPQPSISALQRIFQVQIGRYFSQKDFTAEVKSQLHNIVSAPISVFFKVNQQFKNSPQKSHYIFNLRALHKVIQGIYMADDKVVANKEDIGTFLAHEMIREFHDRLISDLDRDKFYRIISDELHMYFKLNWLPEDLKSQELLYGQFFPHRGSSSTAKVYQSITDKQKLKRLFQDIINSFPTESKNISQFIFFKQSIEHVVRIIRILGQNSGHLLLIGMEGCGKYSNVKISTVIANCELARLSMTSAYDHNSFRADIKKMIGKAVLQNRHCVVYLSDVDDLVNESFMDDLCCLINSGNIPDLYENDELENVLSNLKKDDQGNEVVNDNRSLYDQLIHKINQYLHIFIGLSPINPNHRLRLRNNPNLINCCTIDWYEDWKEESLYSVAQHRITDIISNSNMTFEDSKSEIIQRLVEGCTEIFNCSLSIGQRFFTETRRPYFLSSGDFIEYLNVFSEILQNNYSKNMTNKNRLLNGLNQLTETKILIAKMKEDLIELQPKIKEKHEETERLLSRLQTDKKLVSEIEDIVKDEEEVIKLETEAVEKYSKQCEEDLNTAIPILNSAIEALDSLNKSSISEVRVYRNPPRLVEMVMSAVCVLLSVTPNWANAKLLLSDSNFLNRLLGYDKEKITKKIHRELQTYTNHDDFNPESVGYVSVACKSICQWVLAVDHYFTVNNMVIPKRKNVEEAKSALELSRQKLSWKESQLKKVEDHLRNLDQKYQNSLDEQKSLKERERLTNERLIRAAALIDALQSEKDRWKMGVEEYNESIKYILGSCVISAAYTSFGGPWTTFYRDEACKRWITVMKEKNIPIKDDYKFVESEYSAYEVLNWHNNGLPRDKSMAENVGIMEKSQKWSLLIDPQKQGKQFLQYTYSKSFRVVSCKQKDYIVTLERAIRVGDVLCLEDFETSIDPALGPLLRKEIFYKSNMMTIRLGESELEYSPSFKLFLMTSLSNPQLESSVSRLVAIINFTVNMVGLQEQLLSLVVSKERPEVEEERNRLLKTYATDLKSLRELEDRTLGLLQESTEQIVNDSELAINLEKSKIAAIDIKQRLEETVEAEKQLQIAREFYLPLAIRGAQVYFVLADLSSINYMYQFSLSWFQNLFVTCLNKVNIEYMASTMDPVMSEKTKLDEIINSITLSSYKIASCGLFGMHRPLLSFMLATTIMRYVDDNNADFISPNQWAMFVKLHTTSAVYGENIAIMNKNDEVVKKPDNIEWLTSEIWNKCKFLESQLKDSFSGLCGSICSQSELWIKWNTDDNPYNNSQEVFIDFALSKLKGFDKIILISVLCSHKLIESVLIYVKEVLGEQFSSSSETNLMSLFAQSPSNAPLIFVLGRNSDPMNNVVKLVTELRGSITHLDVVSMGRGQAAKAESLIQKTNIHKGRWIFLQNCDLMISWMPNLQRLVEALQVNKADSDPNFKLIISTHPHPDFPQGILQNSIKIAMESPVGIKNQILKSFSLDGTGHVTKEQFDESPEKMKKMIFNLCLFNAAVLERKHYGCLGFSLPYDFNDSDLEISIKQLVSFIGDNNDVQWEALHNIIGYINYSGRITDSLDRRCLLSLLQKYESDEALDEGLTNFIKGDAAIIDKLSNFDQLNQYLRSDEFTIASAEVVLGLGGNAEIVRKDNQSKSFIYDIVVQQSKHREVESTSDSVSKTIIAMEILKILSNKVPRSVEDYCVEIHGKEFMKSLDPAIPYTPSIKEAIKGDLALYHKYATTDVGIKKFFDSTLHNVLDQEIDQYNTLLNRVHHDMKILMSFLTGERNITENLESVLDHVSINMVPPSWGIISTGKSLSEWCTNITMRIDFLSYWANCVLSDYHEYVDLIYRTAKEYGEKVNVNNEKVNPFKYEYEALRIMFADDLHFKYNKNISCFWLPGFFSPQRFMTAVVQNEARKMNLSIDSMELSLKVLSSDCLLNVQEYFTQSELLDVSKSLSVSKIISQNQVEAEHGVYIFGLYLDNAVWDVVESSLTPNSNHRRFCKLPMVHLLPIPTSSQTIVSTSEIDLFHCPLYKTPSRFGVLSSSGRSSNFICFIDLNSKKPASYWILRGAAALLQYEIE